jgi:hypothetical protein
MKLDIAPFAYRDDPNAQELIFRWEEPREVHRVVLRFAGEAPPLRAVEVAYWRSHWPEARRPLIESEEEETFAPGWQAQDDWFNGDWQPADTTARAAGSEIRLTFAPLGRREFPALAAEYDVRFRQAIKLRLRLPQGCAVAAAAIYTDASLRARDIAIALPAPEWDGEIEVYNGVLESLMPPGATDPRLRLRVACAAAGRASVDHTVVTLRSPACSFSFRPEDLEGGPIRVPDLGVTVTDPRAPRAPRSPSRASCYDRIASRPEQSLQGAMRGQQPKEAMHFIVGCEGARQKFGLAPNGDIFARAGYIRRVPAGDTPRLGWESDGFALRFGWDDWTPSGRQLARGWIPVLAQRWFRGALQLEQEAFAAPLDGDLSSLPADAAVVCLARLTFTNTGATAAMIAQRIFWFGYNAHVGAVSHNTAEPSHREALAVDGDLLRAGDLVRALVATRGRGELTWGDGAMRYHVTLAPGESHTIVVKAPFLGRLTAKEIAALRALDFASAREEVVAFWEERLASAAGIVTPDADINDYARSVITHILINDDHEVNSDRIIGRVSSFNYGNYSNESVMQIMELDRRGYHEEARRHLETYLHYQGTVPLPGNFRTQEGIFYGSGGYESGDYNQHHGWVLWGLAEHYRFTGDGDWLRRIAPRLIAGCDWVISEREATKRTDANGRRVLEYGFLPAGSLEDVRDYYYWLSTNCFTSRGLTAAAEVLAEVGHPEGPRLVREAQAYRDDLLAGCREAMLRSPVVRLRDGTFVPHVPSRLYRRGRDAGWIREVLEGSICMLTTILDANSPEGTWILKDFEDNRYVDGPLNYPLQDFEREWFARGGFSMQPNLVYTLPPYLLRDQIEHFLRAFLNGFAACFRRDLRAMAEHEAPTLVEWAGDHFKSSDESMAMMWLRMMFIQEEGDTLSLGRGLPRAWVGSERGVAIRGAATHFGPMSFALRAEEGGRRIVAEIDPPVRRPPAKIVVRFRHPGAARLLGVTVNDTPVETFDADKEWVVLPGRREHTVVVARCA